MNLQEAHRIAFDDSKDNISNRAKKLSRLYYASTETWSSVTTTAATSIEVF
jgi:hypothetical protein